MLNLNAETQRIAIRSESVGRGTTESAIHAGYGVDRNFLMPAGVSMVSLLESNPGQAFVFHVMIPSMDEIRECDMEKFRELVQSYKNADVVIHVIDTSVLTGAPTSRNYSTAVYYRFFFPFLVPEQPQLLYLDADIVCLGDLHELCSLAMGTSVVAACYDKSSRTEDPMFNSGFLWMQADVWREQQISEQCIEYVQHNAQRVFYDQEALNQILKGRVQFLPDRYNFQMRKQEYEMIPEDVVFLHFSEEKPWRAWYDRQDQSYFLRYKNKSPWRDVEPELPKNYQQMKFMAEYCLCHQQWLEAGHFFLRYGTMKARKILSGK